MTNIHWLDTRINSSWWSVMADSVMFRFISKKLEVKRLSGRGGVTCDCMSHWVKISWWKRILTSKNHEKSGADFILAKIILKSSAQTHWRPISGNCCMFSHVTENWRGRPLVSHEVGVNLVGAITTRKGLSIHSKLDKGSYPIGIKMTKVRMNSFEIKTDNF